MNETKKIKIKMQEYIQLETDISASLSQHIRVIQIGSKHSVQRLEGQEDAHNRINNAHKISSK